jgi:hypothetical protein
MRCCRCMLEHYQSPPSLQEEDVREVSVANDEILSVNQAFICKSKCCILHACTNDFDAGRVASVDSSPLVKMKCQNNYLHRTILSARPL